MGSEADHQGTEFTLGLSPGRAGTGDLSAEGVSRQEAHNLGGGEAVERALTLFINLSGIFWSTLTTRVAWCQGSHRCWVIVNDREETSRFSL